MAPPPQTISKPEGCESGCYLVISQVWKNGCQTTERASGRLKERYEPISLLSDSCAFPTLIIRFLCFFLVPLDARTTVSKPKVKHWSYTCAMIWLVPSAGTTQNKMRCSLISGRFQRIVLWANKWPKMRIRSAIQSMLVFERSGF